ncbi:hypothetical protein NIES2107_71920 (plasmid) [Nostoc carneum NIES-2107]|nr:hypothetical protein NIES2107_71920 [Nostoc carneum NIES-2107]
MTTVSFAPLGTEEIIEVSAELRYYQKSETLKVYLKTPVEFLEEETEALKEQWEELIAIFPQMTEYGFSKVRLSRIDGEMFRKPYFDWNIRWVNGLDSPTRRTDGYWEFGYAPSFNTDPFGYQLAQNVQIHQKTWTAPYDRPRGFIPTRENRGQWTAAQVRNIQFYGALTEAQFWADRG